MYLNVRYDELEVKAFGVIRIPVRRVVRHEAAGGRKDEFTLATTRTPLHIYVRENCNWENY
jgi:hypothetical protein